MTKVTCELRALEPGPGSAGADGGPAGAACTKCRGLSAGEANAGAVLREGSVIFLNFKSPQDDSRRILAHFKAATMKYRLDSMNREAATVRLKRGRAEECITTDCLAGFEYSTC